MHLVMNEVRALRVAALSWLNAVRTIWVSRKSRVTRRRGCRDGLLVIGTGCPGGALRPDGGDQVGEGHIGGIPPAVGGMGCDRAGRG